LSGGKLSSSNVFLIFIRKSFVIRDESCASPLLGNGARLGPLGPPLLDTPMIAPGTICIACGLITPSSTAVNTPPILRLAFFKFNSTTLFRVLISGSAYRQTPLPYISPGATMYLDMTQGKDFKTLCSIL